MKIYTGSGDRGKTSLFSGERVSKSHPRIDACGDIDELNSILGALIAAVPAGNSDLVDELRHIQTELLQIGAWMSATPGSPARADVAAVSDKQVAAMEQAIDRMERSLPELKDFLLPGGHMSAAWAHVARAVCRRVERRMVRLFSKTGADGEAEPDTTALVFINRLSDYLFELARYLNRSAHVPETPWKK